MAATVSSSTNSDGIAIWQIKRMLQDLGSVRGNGTTLITVMLPPGYQIAQMTQKLVEEQGTADHIKSRVTRNSVISAITSVLYALKQYKEVPENGLVICCGDVMSGGAGDAKERKVTRHLVPHKPIRNKMYMCDSRFHLEPLIELCADEDKYGFVIMDGHGTLFGTLVGSHRQVLHKFSVDLPNKHGRGGQSAPRFGRIREEKRGHYVVKVAELMSKFFLSPLDGKPNVTGIVLAGLADFKNDLEESEALDPRLASVVLATVDLNYGGMSGFNQAIVLSAGVLSNVKFVQEKKLIGGYFEEIAQDSRKFSYGVHDTMEALEAGAVHTLIVWENLETRRVTVRNGLEQSTKVLYISPQEEAAGAHLRTSDGSSWDVVESVSLAEWLAENLCGGRTVLEFVSDSTPEGYQFVTGFGGFGALLRYEYVFQHLHLGSSSDDDDSDGSSSDNEGDI